jgi:hypothetical protein
MAAAKSTPKSVAEKLNEQDAKGTRTGANAPSKSSAADKPAAKPKSSLSRDTLIKAAKLRSEGATWNAIREATGTKLGSTAFFKAWERENIEHIAAGQRVKAKDEPAAEAAPAKAEPAKRSGKANGPRTSKGKAAPVTTRKATAAERARPAA